METMPKISIARALIELKTLEKRIDKKLHELEPISILTGNKLESGIDSKEAFEKEVKASYQSLIALIEYKRKIKSAIVKSNAVTYVEIAGAKMTVAEAIERKSSIGIEKEIKKTLAKKYTDKLKIVENHNSNIQSQLYKLLQATYSKPETELSKEDYDKIAIPFKENNDATLIDPLNVKKTLQELDEEISEFESEVDIALTESNARTEVEV
jgi:RNase P subunit RPR2